MSRLSFLLFPVLLLHIANAQLKQCYYLGGQSSSTDYPCNPEAETSTCCGGDWICGTNLYCESQAGDRYQGSCTDSKWDINNNPACPFALSTPTTSPPYDHLMLTALQTTTPPNLVTTTSTTNLTPLAAPIPIPKLCVQTTISPPPTRLAVKLVKAYSRSTIRIANLYP